MVFEYQAQKCKHKKQVFFWFSWSHVQRRNKSTCFFDVLVPCAQNTRKTNAFWTQCYKTTVKLMVFALPPDQCCSNAIKTNDFLMQGPKNTVKLMVSATLVGGPRNFLVSNSQFPIPNSQFPIPHSHPISQFPRSPEKPLFRVLRRQGVIIILCWLNWLA